MHSKPRQPAQATDTAKSTSEGKSYSRALLFLWRYILRHKYSYLIGIVLIVLNNRIMVAIPEYMRISIDLLEQAHTAAGSSELGRNLLLMTALSVAVIFVRSFSRVLFFNPGRAIEYQIKQDLFAKLMALPQQYYESRQTGGILSRVNNDISGVRMLCGFGMMQVFNIASALSLAPMKMLQISATLTLYVCLPIFACFGVVYYGMRLMYKHQQERRNALEDISARSGAMLSGVGVIKSFALFDHAESRFDSPNAKYLHHALRGMNLRTVALPILQYLPYMMQAVILIVGGHLVLQEQLTVGQLTAFIAYSFLIASPLISLSWVSTMLQRGFIGLFSVKSIFDQAEIPALSQPATEDKLFLRGLEVCGLSFSYAQHSQDSGGQEMQPVLKDISFSIAPGESIGILGAVGAGKSTLTNCLNGYLEVPEQSIFIDGKALEEYNLHDLRRSIRTVSQDIFLFSDTIANNINFGSHSATEPTGAQQEQAIYKASLQDELEKFPQGAQTLIGEKGVMLSGGQKQRVSIARAMMDSCDLLILDNALSAVDTVTEKFLLEQLLQRDTCQSLVIISHRISALSRCDRILVLEEGRILQSGTHQELIAQDGFYARTFILQGQQEKQAYEQQNRGDYAAG